MSGTRVGEAGFVHQCHEFLNTGRRRRPLHDHGATDAMAAHLVRDEVQRMIEVGYRDDPPIARCRESSLPARRRQPSAFRARKFRNSRRVRTLSIARVVSTIASASGLALPGITG